jgi:hypothetical protein
MKLSVLGLGIAMGLLWGLLLMVWTLLALYMPEAGITLLASFTGYLGYSVSVPGAFLALAYGFVEGFVGGSLLAVFYNLLAKK